jgi:hypothetical protein
MARSYSMQVGLSILLAGLALRWFEKPGSKGRAAGVWAAALALLYTHYVPGIALLAGVMVAGWRVVGVARLAGLLACAGAGYLPWGMGLWEAATRWGGAAGFSSQYTLTGNLLGEQLLKLGFGLVSLSLGESFAVVSLLLAPVVLLLAWRGFRAGGFPGSFLLLVGSAAVVGYLGVARWVSYPFIPGRMLWTLPFLCLGVAAGLAGLAPGRWRTACGAALALSAVVSTIHYYQREGFLNPGYTVPLQAIAARLNGGASAHGLILFDSFNTDYHAIIPWLSGRTPHVLLTPGNRREVMSRAGAAAEVWIVRNTRDASPGGTTGEVAAAVCAGRRVREELYQPYAGWQRAVLRWAGFQPGLTHFYRVERCSASEPVR